MPGPPPKDPATRRRRNKPVEANFKLLPHEGRAGPPPPWPFPGDGVSTFELSEWARLWSLPQAVEWERMRCEPTIALYVRALALAIMGEDKMFAEVRQLDKKIGVSPEAMRAMRWETDEPLEDEPEPIDEPAAPVLDRTYIPPKP